MELPPHTQLPHPISLLVSCAMYNCVHYTEHHSVPPLYINIYCSSLRSDVKLTDLHEM